MYLGKCCISHKTIIPDMEREQFQDAEPSLNVQRTCNINAECEF